MGGTAEPAVRLLQTTHDPSLNSSTLIPAQLPPQSEPLLLLLWECDRPRKTFPGFECKLFEEWDQDLGFLVISRGHLTQGFPVSTCASNLSSFPPLRHTLHFYHPELLLLARKAMSFIICHHLQETRVTGYLTARQARQSRFLPC